MPHSRPQTQFQLDCDSQVNAVTFSPDGELIAAGTWSGSVFLWSARTGQQRRRVCSLAQPENVFALAFSPCGSRLAIGGGEAWIDIRDTTSWKSLASDDLDEDIHAIAYSTDGKQLLCGKGESEPHRSLGGWQRPEASLVVLDADTCEKIRQLSRGIGVVYSAAFSPDGALAAAGHTGVGGTTNVWRAPSWEPLPTAVASPDQVMFVAFSPEWRLLATTTRHGLVSIYNTDTWKTVTGFGEGARCLATAFCPRSSVIAIARSDNTISLIDWTTGEVWSVLSGEFDGIWSLAFSPDGSMLAAGGVSGKVICWSMGTPPCRSPRSLQPDIREW